MTQPVDTPYTPRRKSIEPTYDARETGHPYTVTVRVDGETLPPHGATIPDPFVRQVIVVGWRDLARHLLTKGRKSLEVDVRIDGTRDRREDVLELNADYLGAHDSTRRREWNAGIQRALEDQ